MTKKIVKKGKIKLHLYIIQHNNGIDIAKGPQMAIKYLSELGAYNVSLDKEVTERDRFSLSDAFEDADKNNIYIEERDATIEIVKREEDEGIVFSPSLKTYWKEVKGA